MELRSRLTGRLPLLVLIITILQPLMDIISFWLQRLSLSTTPVLLLRFLVLGCCTLLAFCLCRKRKSYLIPCAAVLLLLVGHITACVLNGYQDPVSDLTNLIRILQLPLMAAVFMVCLHANPDCFRTLKLGCLINLLIICAVVLLATVTDTAPATYSDGCGYIGWFYNTNSQSAILCALVPIGMAYAYRCGHRHILFWLTTLAGMVLLWLFGTRLAYFGLIVIGLGWAISLLLISRQNWKTCVLLVLITGLFLALFPVSELKVHLNTNAYVLSDRQSTIGDMLTELPAEWQDLTAEEVHALSEEDYQALTEALTPVYEKYVGDFCEEFGTEATMELFGYSTKFSDFSDVRAKKLLFARQLMQSSSPLSRIFGLEISRFTVGKNIYDVENDFWGIYYLTGAYGCLLLLCMLLYFVGLVIWALLKDAKFYFTPDSAALGIAFLLLLMHAIFTAGVLRRPNASFYLSLVCAGLYDRVRLNPKPANPGQ